MSILRVGEIDFNDQGNASIQLANSWNVALVTSGTIRLEARTDGSVAVPGSLNVGSITFSTGQTVGAANVQTFDTSGTWTKPAGYSASSRVYVQAWGAGGSGGRHTTATFASGGGGGGYIERWLNLSQLGATETITIGAGGAARTATNQNGAAGGNTTVGSLVTAYGGGGGCGTVSLGSGGSGGGQLSAGSTSAGSSLTDPGRPFFAVLNDDGSGGNLRQGSGLNNGGDSTATNLAAFMHGGGGGCASTNVNAASSVYGGGGGGGNTTGAGGTSLFGGNGGAAGANGTNGTQPGGAGGAATGTSGAGAAGRVIVTVFPG